MGVDKNQFFVVNNGLDLSVFTEHRESQRWNFRESLGIKPEAPVICGVFRLQEEKRPLMFIDVVQRVKSKIPDLKVVIAGEGYMEEEMRARMRELGLSDLVTLLGRRQDIPLIMSSSDVVLLTSREEGMPNVLLEAQSCGVPVVATRVGGVPQVPLDGNTVFVCGRDTSDE
jgi:glycosyltransferase involved in cell wall biosynthesis